MPKRKLSPRSGKRAANVSSMGRPKIARYLVGPDGEAQIRVFEGDLGRSQDKEDFETIRMQLRKKFK